MAGDTTPKIVFATANLAQSRDGWRSPEWFSDYAHEAGYDGIEYHTLHTQLYPAECLAKAVVRDAVDLNSLHMSFRTNRDSRDTNQFDGNSDLTAKLIDSPLGGLVMPDMFGSAHYMGKVQERLDHPVPVVVYPQKSEWRDVHDRHLAQAFPRITGAKALFQPTDHVARLVEAKTMDEFLDTMFEARGYNGLCLDTFHARRQYGEGNGLISRRRNFDELLSYTRAVHLSLNRQDFAQAEPQIKTEQDLHDALTGQYSGYVENVLDYARASGQVGYIVVEVTSKALMSVAKEHGFKTPGQGYKRIADHLRSWLGL